MISALSLVKNYGRTVAVRDLTFTVRPGVVTGFLGPNGAGKSTTMRMLIGLDRPDAWRGHGQRQALPRAARAAARSRLDAGGQVVPPRPLRPGPPGRARRVQRHSRPAGR